MQHMVPWKRGGKPLDFNGKPDQSLGKRAVVKHFVSLGIPEKVLNRNLVKFECGEKLERKPGSGRRVVKLPVSARRRLLRQSCDRVGVPLRKLAPKFEVIKSLPEALH